MSDSEYHRIREKQCRDMADKAHEAKVKDCHMTLAELHHRLTGSDDDEDSHVAVRHAH